jgi:hypothetical protein
LPEYVVHWRELVRGLKQLEAAEKRNVRLSLRHIGEAVKDDAAGRIAPKSAKTAAGFKVSVTQRGVGVYQSLKKTTGKHPEWGGYQIVHALLPARRDNEQEIHHALEEALDKASEAFNRGTM